ncbi:MAG TPA: DUF4350 domain-containing protein [Streptosporangiaceae bacterium]|nr:DUF4350 domain-containing protein [Streptosporangiaceae bacterium]
MTAPPAHWRRWRLPLALIAMIVLGGILIAVLAPAQRPNSYLDPASTAPAGAHALADILGERGFDVTAVYSPAAAIAAAGQPSSGPPSATLVVTMPDLLTLAQQRRLARSDADLFLVGPGSASLRRLAAAVTVANASAASGYALRPGCVLTAARLAGSADLGGITYRVPADATGCYPAGGDPALARYVTAGRTITILGSGRPLSNLLLADQGNAALDLNLMNAHRRIVWLTPEPANPPAIPVGGAQPGPTQALIPWPAWLVVFQLGIALILAALWRGRRFGPLITERLPVVVRASETVEGHARLYQSRRARDRAAAALRDASIARIVPALGLATGTPAGAVVDALASRSALSRERIGEVLNGPPPANDTELVALSRSLDELEREVRS